jgi:hypothetical protein
VVRKPGSENDDGADFSSRSVFQKFSASENRYSEIENQPVARGGVDSTQSVHDRAHHPVANHGQDDFAHPRQSQWPSRFFSSTVL